MKRTLGVSVSLSLHLLVALALLDVTSREQKLPKQADPVAVHELPGDAGTLTGELANGLGLACGGYHYNGVGIAVSPWSGIIGEVGKGTPAELAGLLAGDKMLDPNQLGPDAHPPGTVVPVLIERDGRRITVKVTIGRICNDR